MKRRGFLKRILSVSAAGAAAAIVPPTSTKDEAVTAEIAALRKRITEMELPQALEDAGWPQSGYAYRGVLSASDEYWRHVGVFSASLALLPKVPLWADITIDGKSYRFKPEQE